MDGRTDKEKTQHNRARERGAEGRETGGGTGKRRSRIMSTWRLERTDRPREPAEGRSVGRRNDGRRTATETAANLDPYRPKMRKNETGQRRKERKTEEETDQDDHGRTHAHGWVGATTDGAEMNIEDVLMHRGLNMFIPMSYE